MNTVTQLTTRFLTAKNSEGSGPKDSYDYSRAGGINMRYLSPKGYAESSWATCSREKVTLD